MLEGPFQIDLKEIFSPIAVANVNGLNELPAWR